MDMLGEASPKPRRQFSWTWKAGTASSVVLPCRLGHAFCSWSDFRRGWPSRRARGPLARHHLERDLDRRACRANHRRGDVPILASSAHGTRNRTDGSTTVVVRGVLAGSFRVRAIHRSLTIHRRSMPGRPLVEDVVALGLRPGSRAVERRRARPQRAGVHCRQLDLCGHQPRHASRGSPVHAVLVRAGQARSARRPEAGRRLSSVSGQATAFCWNCSSSVDPVSAVVDDCPCWIAWVTASK